MATTLTTSFGCWLELQGDLNFTLNPGFAPRSGYVGFSDGSLFSYKQDENEMFCFRIVIPGSLFDRIEPGVIYKGKGDTLHFKDGLKWAIATNTEEGFVFKREKGEVL